MSKLTINTRQRRFPVAPNLYGLFYEDINRGGDNGMYPELLRNRAFEDSLPPEGCNPLTEINLFHIFIPPLFIFLERSPTA